MKYFVTGATGFVGSHLTKSLLERGDKVVALVRDPSRAQELKKRGASLAVGDIADKDSMRAAMEHVDGLFHVAGWYQVGQGNHELGYAVNVGGTRNVLELMAELSIRKGVYTSTLTINSNTGGVKVDERYHFRGQHLSTYDETKALAHHEVAKPMMKAGLPLVIVQPGGIYGPGDSSATGDSIRDFLRGDLPMLPKQTAICWAHVDDVVQGHLLAMEKGRTGKSYIIAGPCHTIIDFFNIASEISGVPAPKVQAPAWFLKALAIPMGLLDKLLPLPPEFTGEGLRVIAGTTYLGDNGKAKRELGYEPRSVREGLRQALPAYQSDIRQAGR